MKPPRAPRLGLALVMIASVLTTHANTILIPPQDIAKATKALTKVRQLMSTMKVTKPGAVLTVPDPRQDAEGKYLFPYLADGTLAPWARKGMGGAAGVAGTVGGHVVGRRSGGTRRSGLSE